MADGTVKIDITANDSDVNKKLKGVGDEAKNTKKDVDGLGEEVDNTSEQLDDMGDSAGNAEKGIGVLGVAVGNLAAQGLSALISKLGECVGSLFSLAEETVEYREDMAKLDAAFTTAGHSSETASAAYKSFYGILGESDRSVEAVNHLAELTKNEQEVAEWANIAAGVTAKFGDSLPIEGLTEAANETAKVGQVTGPLADALNWAGISEEEFNQKLAACNDEQERATLITETLSAEYEEAAEAYNKATADIQALRKAEAELTDAQAEMGAAMTPLVALYKTGLAGALSTLVPQVSMISEGLQDMFNGVDGGAEKVVSGISGALNSVLSTITSALPTLIPMGVELISSLITGIVQSLPQVVAGIALLISEVAGALPGLMQTIVTALPTVIQSIVSVLPTLIPELVGGISEAVTMLANNASAIIQPLIAALPDIIVSLIDTIMANLPLVIEGIISLVMAIVEAIPQIIDGIVQALPTAISLIISGLLKCIPQIIGGLLKVVVGVVASLPSIFASLIEGIIGIAVGIWNGIADVFKAIGSWFGEKFTEAWEAIQNAWSSVVSWFSGIWDSICDVFNAIGSWFSGKFSEAWTGIQNAWSSVVAWFAGIWSSITGVFAAVGTWFSNKFSEAIAGIKNVWSGIKAFFTSKWNEITSVFSGAKDKFLSIGKNIVDGIKQGISNAWNNLKTWFTGLFGDLIGIAKKILGINSPSREFRYIAEMIIAGLQQGLDKTRDLPTKSLHKVFDGMQSAVDKRAEDLKVTMADYNKEIEDENKSHNDTLLKLEEDRNERQTELDEKYAENLKKSGADRAKLKKEYEKDVADLNEKFNEDVEKENQRHVDSLGKIEDNKRTLLDSKMRDLLDLEEDYTNNVSKLWDDLANDIASAQKKYDDQLKSRTESIANSLGIWDRATKNAVSGRDLTRNLKSQVGMLEAYNTAISSLEGRGVSEDFIQFLKEMGVDATGEIEAIADMTDRELAEYVGLWEEKNALAHDAAVEELEPLKAETEAEIQALTDAALDKYTEYRTTFAEQSALLMQDLKNSITEAGLTGYEEIIGYVDDYTAAGEDLMDGIVIGIMDKSPLVADAVSDAVSRAIEAAKAEAGIHSPSRVMRDEVGKQMGAGFIEGWHNKVAAIKKAMSNDVQNIVASVSATVGAENARFAHYQGVSDNGMADLTRAVGIQTAGITSLAGEFNRGAHSTKPVIIELNGRELGRAVIETGSAETVRMGGKLALGGAY